MTYTQVFSFLEENLPIILFTVRKSPVVLPWGGNMGLRSKELKYNFQYFNFLNSYKEYLFH